MVKEYARRTAPFLILLLALAVPVRGQVILTPVAGVVTVDIGTCGQGGGSPNPTCTFKLTMTANATLAFNNVFGGAQVNLFINPGSFTLTWPASVPIPTPTLAANQNNAVSLRFDGTAGTWTAVGGGGGGSPGQFSVKTYGAVGDTHASRNCTTTASSKVVTSADNPWVAADVGKFMEIIQTATGADIFTPARKIASFQSAGQVTMDTIQDGGASPGGGNTCKWFTQDDTAAFVAAKNAAKAAVSAFRPRDQTPTLGYSSTVICPPGGYTVSGTIFMDNPATVSLGIGLSGDRGGSHCVIYPTATFVGTNDPVCTAVLVGLIFTCNTEKTSIENIYIEGQSILIPNTSVGANRGWIEASHCGTCTVRNNTVTNLSMASGGTSILSLASFSGVAENNFIQNGALNEGACSIGQSTGLLFSNNLCSNHLQSLVINGSGTRGSGGGQLTILNEATDECTGGGLPCTQISGSVVNFVGGSAFGGVPELMSIDGTSSVYMTDHNLQQFGSSSANIPGVTIASGGLLVASNSTFASNGTATIISGPAGATYIDVGGNTYLNCLSGTCTKVGASDFTTHGFSGGIIPKSTQTHTPNTCYAVTGNLLATAQNLCIVLLDQNYQLLNLTAQSGGTTPANSSCATPPVITLSDGTRTATMTMTSGKAAWNSSVDAVTNINQVFASGATLTVSIGANTCATPPANVSVNYNLQSAVNP